MCVGAKRRERGKVYESEREGEKETVKRRWERDRDGERSRKGGRERQRQ